MALPYSACICRDPAGASGCPGTLPVWAGGLWAAQTQLPISKRQLIFSPLCAFQSVQSLEPCFAACEGANVTRTLSLGSEPPREATAQPAALAAPASPSQPAAASAPGPRETAANKRPLLSCCPGSCKEWTSLSWQLQRKTQILFPFLFSTYKL